MDQISFGNLVCISRYLLKQTYIDGSRTGVFGKVKRTELLYSASEISCDVYSTTETTPFLIHKCLNNYHKTGTDEVIRCEGNDKKKIPTLFECLKYIIFDVLKFSISVFFTSYLAEYISSRNFYVCIYVCVFLQAYGGFLSSLLLLSHISPFRCGVAMAPVSDWRLYGTTEDITVQ